MGARIEGGDVCMRAPTRTTAHVHAPPYARARALMHARTNAEAAERAALSPKCRQKNGASASPSTKRWSSLYLPAHPAACTHARTYVQVERGIKRRSYMASYLCLKNLLNGANLVRACPRARACKHPHLRGAHRSNHALSCTLAHLRTCAHASTRACTGAPEGGDQGAGECAGYSNSLGDHDCC